MCWHEEQVVDAKQEGGMMIDEKAMQFATLSIGAPGKKASRRRTDNQDRVLWMISLSTRGQFWDDLSIAVGQGLPCLSVGQAD